MVQENEKVLFISFSGSEQAYFFPVGRTVLGFSLRVWFHELWLVRLVIA